MFPSTRRAITILFKTPLLPPAPGPAMVEMQSLAGPSRPRAASRTFSNVSVKSAYGYSLDRVDRRGYASDYGKKELYSDEAGSSGAGTDDVAKTDAAFNKDPNPESAAKQVEQETGKDFTKRSPANPDESKPPGRKDDPEASDSQLRTSKSEAKKH